MPMRRENVAAALRYLQDKADLRGRLQRATSLDPQEQDLADIAVETGASLVPGVGPALAARDFERARRADDEAGMAMAAAGAIPGGKLAKLLKGFDPTRLELDVYHGTPHRFPATEANPLGEFDASKIGTGEGAQAYGHGIYYAESPSVAESYARMDSPFAKSGLKGQAATVAALAKQDAPGGPSNAAKYLADNYDSQVKRYGKADVDAAIASLQSGTLYKADLPDEMIDRMLDWDKPLSEQPAAVKNLFPTLEEAKAIDAEMIRLSEATLAANDINGPAQAAWEAMYKSPQYKMAKIVVDEADPKLGKKFANGQRIYRAIGGGDDKASAEQLRAFGIPGIKYLDAGSRGQGGTGTRNFVVFPGEEKKVRILERDGQKAPPQKIAQALEATSKSQNLVDVFNKTAKREIELANKRIVDPDEPYLTQQPISNLKELDQLTDPIFNYAKANVLKHIGEKNGFKVKIEGSNVSPSVYAKFTKVDDEGVTDFKVRISDHADVSRNKPAGEKKAYDINPDSNGSMEEIIQLLNDQNWLKQFYELD